MAFRFAGVLFVALAASSAASAASLDNVRGTVSVNRVNQDGFVPVTTEVDVKDGDRVMVGPGGYARIVYHERCVQPIEANTTAVVDTERCKSVPGGLLVGGGAGLAGAFGSTAGAVVGGTIVTGFVAGAVAAASDDDDPASP